jgi:transcriptional regulator with XRE-family HTH domain
MYFARNIKLLRSRTKKSQDELATELGMTRSSLSAYENGTAEPGFDALVRFSEHYNVSVDKLLKTDLSALSEAQLSEIEKGYDIDLSGNRLRVLSTTVDKDDRENIELVPVKARAGYTSGYADPDFIRVLPAFNLPFLDRQKKYRTFQISGDSMPPVADGSWVTGEYVQNWNHIRDRFPYIVVTKEEGVVFKIVYNKIKDNQCLLLCSTNPAYDPYEINISEVLEVWKFTNYISAELPEPNLSKDELASTVLNLQREVMQIKNTLRKH